MRKMERGVKPSRNRTRSTNSVSFAKPDNETIAAPGFPTATVIRAFGNRCRIARSAGKLSTTSPSWPKSITRMLRGSKLISNAYQGILRRHDRRGASPDAAESHALRRERLAAQNRRYYRVACVPDSQFV